MLSTEPNRRRFHLTPGHCLFALLTVEFLLFLSQCFRWLPKGWPVLIAVAAVGVVVLGMFAWLGVAVVLGRRFQFTIRSLLVLVVVAALPCNWLAVEIKHARQEQETVELLSASDCVVFGDDSTDESGNLDFAKMTPLPAEGPLLTGLLGKGFFHTATAVLFVKLDIGSLVSKHDEYNRFHFGKYKKPDVAQSILLALKNLPDLRALDLSEMPVDDSDLEAVIPLKELRQLDLTGTKVTDAGVAKLQQALPNCKITR